MSMRFLFLLLTSFAALPSYASCARPNPIRNLLRCDLVFSGQVVEIDTLSMGHALTTFAVDRMYTGRPVDHVTLHSSLSHGNGIRFEVGDSVVIYTRKDQQGALRVSGCPSGYLPNKRDEATVLADASALKSLLSQDPSSALFALMHSPNKATRIAALQQSTRDQTPGLRHNANTVLHSRIVEAIALHRTLFANRDEAAAAASGSISRPQEWQRRAMIWSLVQRTELAVQEAIMKRLRERDDIAAGVSILTAIPSDPSPAVLHAATNGFSYESSGFVADEKLAIQYRHELALLVDACFRLADHTDPRVQFKAVDKLVRLRELFVFDLCQILNHPDPGVRRYADNRMDQ